MKLNRKQFQTKNFKGVLSLLAGNTISKVIATLGGLILANYYGPESYGIYNVFLSYILIMTVLTSLRLDNVMIMQRGSKEIRNLFSGILIISFVLTLVLVLGMAILKYFNLASFDISYFVLSLTALGGILSVWNQTQNNMFTKYKLFKQISTALIIASLFSIVFQALFYFTGFIENGLIYGWIIGLIVSFIYNMRVAKSRFQKVDIALFKKSVRENSKIIRFTYPSDAINSIATNIMPILVLAYFTQAEVGIFAMAFKILSIPLLLLSNSVSRVYFQKAVSLFGYDNQSLQRITYKIIGTNVAVIAVFLVLINSIGIYLLNHFLNEKWDGLGAYIWTLSFWILARSSLNPISPLVIVLKKNHYSLLFNIYLLLVNFLAVYIGVQNESFLYGIGWFSFLSGLGYLSLLTAVLLNLNRHVKS
ncbi:MAG: oligosaccharide flippase family protein [Weeksellaceae bacterium]|nr:oligosaccharide flippase family protein [Weeksellaceae bacterium]